MTLLFALFEFFLPIHRGDGAPNALNFRDSTRFVSTMMPRFRT